MKLSKLVPIALCAAIVACSPSGPEANAPAAEASAPADAAGDTVAIYGDEAPVAIKAEDAEADGDHAHNADGSHAEGEEHAQDAESGQPAKAEAEAEHAHEPGQAAHDH